MADFPHILDREQRTFERLDDIVTILGTTKAAFYPFPSAFGSGLFPYGAGSVGIRAFASDEVGPKGIDDEFQPMPLAGGLHALYFDSAANNHIRVSFGSNFSFEGDDPFSLGAWIMMTEELGTQHTIMAKFGETANLEEYDFRFDTSGNLVLELHDASASASQIATGAGDVLVPWTWSFVVATYDGVETAPGIRLYRNAVDQGDDTVTESGTYDEMEDTAARLLIGARDATGTPKQEFEGYMWGAFITGKELSPGEVTQIDNIGREIIGVV